MSPRRQPNAKRSRKILGSNILERLDTAQSAAVLRGLLKGHPDLEAEAERIALELVGTTDVESVAVGVFDSLRLLDLEDLNSRAGDSPIGYVSPDEAAWELQDDATKPFFDDLRRQIALGLESAAVSTCQGIILGLYRCRTLKNHPVIGWAEDFLLDAAMRAFGLVAKMPAGDRSSSWRLPEDFLSTVPDWERKLSMPTP